MKNNWCIVIAFILIFILCVLCEWVESRGRYDFRFAPKYKRFSGTTAFGSQTDINVEMDETIIIGAFVKISDESGMWHLKGARGGSHFSVAIDGDIVSLQGIGEQMENKEFVIWVLHR